MWSCRGVNSVAASDRCAGSGSAGGDGGRCQLQWCAPMRRLSNKYTTCTPLHSPTQPTPRRLAPKARDTCDIGAGHARDLRREPNKPSSSAQPCSFVPGRRWDRRGRHGATYWHSADDHDHDHAHSAGDTCGAFQRQHAGCPSRRHWPSCASDIGFSL